MRISDWSSDVCSSDRAPGDGVAAIDRTRRTLARAPCTLMGASPARDRDRYAAPARVRRTRDAARALRHLLGNRVRAREIGREPGREGGCQDGTISGVSVSLKKHNET